MSSINDNLRDALDAIVTGDLDGHTPDQIARLEARLNANADARASLADVVPAVEPALHAAVEVPPDDVWEDVWQRIDESVSAEPQPLLLRLWRPLTAVAACVLMVGFWSMGNKPAVADWPVEWAQEVEIDELEVSEGATPLVAAVGSEDPVPVIWVIDDES